MANLLLKHLQPGQRLPFLPLKRMTMAGEELVIPDSDRGTHIMFRRFAGCPICNVALRAYLQRIDQLRTAKVHSVVVFHSSESETKRFQSQLPISVIADEHRELYRLFGVGTSIRSVADPRTWWVAIKEILRSGLRMPTEQQNPFVLPADFLIDTDGCLTAAHYAQHAADVWDADQVLRLQRDALGHQQRD